MIKALRYLGHELTLIDGLNWPGIFHKLPEKMNVASYFL